MSVRPWRAGSFLEVPSGGRYGVARAYARHASASTREALQGFIDRETAKGFEVDVWEVVADAAPSTGEAS